MDAVDEAALYRLAARYAQAVDRNEPDTIAALFTSDAVIEGEGFHIQGIEAIRGIPAMLRQRYAKTQHVLHQQTATISGDSAEAETHCTANHISAGDPPTNLVWAIRYQDRFRRDAGQWRFVHRRLVIDWTETRTVRIS
jgi:uncharacterized protein (TIGR02246 family)